MSNKKDLERLIALANTLRAAAQALSDHAFELWNSGELSNEDYDKVGNDYLEIIRQIQQLQIAGSKATAANLGPLLDQVEDAKGQLNAQLKRIKKVKDVLSITAKMLSVTGALVAAVAAPASAPAAVTAVIDLVQTWVRVADGKTARPQGGGGPR